MRKFVLFTATAGGLGYAPVAPGTFGSLVGVGLWAGLAGQGPVVLAGATLAVTGLAVGVSGPAEGLLGRDDGRIVIDEVAGALLALLFLPLRLDVAIVGFALFRLFDIAKPPPVRQAERLPGGLGVVADDLVAGLYANAAGQLLWRAVWPEGLL